MSGSDFARIQGACDELERLTVAQALAIRDDDVERLNHLLDQRAELISSLNSLMSATDDAAVAAVKPTIGAILRLDEDNRLALAEELNSLKRQITVLEVGRQALNGYSYNDPWQESAYLDKRR